MQLVDYENRIRRHGRGHTHVVSGRVPRNHQNAAYATPHKTVSPMLEVWFQTSAPNIEPMAVAIVMCIKNPRTGESTRTMDAIVNR